jgi:hypothetical protein
MNTKAAISLAIGIAVGAVVAITSENIAMGIGVGHRDGDRGELRCSAERQKMTVGET